MQNKGKFITFEGGEGAGKTTQIRRLADFLQKQNIEVVLTREPGGSKNAEEIRKLIVSGDKNRWDALTEVLLFSAARRNHLQNLILPALDAGKWVLCDRFYDSTIAYQGYGYDEKKAVDKEVIDYLYKLIAGDFVPDMTFILDIPVDKGMERVSLRAEDKARFELMNLDFHQRLRDAFIKIAKDNTHRCLVINALDDMDTITKNITDRVKQRFL